MKLVSVKPCVIVASMGRSGSTLCFSTLHRSARTWLKKNPAMFQSSLSRATLRRGTIIKTHDYPDGLRTRNESLKVLFIFGSTYEAALSVYTCRDRFGADWVTEHFKNCKSPFEFNDLFRCDALGMAQQIKAWSVFDQVPVLCVRFDAIWENAGAIARFTGYPFNLPPRLTRDNHALPDDLRQCAKRVYGPLDEEIDKLPDMFMAGPDMASRLAGIPVDPAFSVESRG